MDTRWKRFKTHAIIKFLAFVLVALAITGVVVLIQYDQYIEGNIESLVVDRYVNSDYFREGELLESIYKVSMVASGEDRIPKNAGYRFYVSDGENEYANTILKSHEDFEKAGENFYYLSDDVWYEGKGTGRPLRTYYDASKLERSYITFNDDFINKKQIAWEQGNIAMRPIIIGFACFALIGLGLLLYLISVTGRKPNSDEFHLNWVDRIYTDINVALFLPVGLIWGATMSEFFRFSPMYSQSIGAKELLSMTVVGLITFGSVTVLGVLFLSLIRKIKAGIFIRHSILYKFFAKIFDLFKSLFDGRVFKKYPMTKALFFRQWVFISVSALLVAMTFFFIVAPPLMILPPILEVVVIYWYVKGNNKTFKEINAGFDKSLGDQVKAERMKVDLVTNVSHDLKTPLTAIISYVDLLQKEENLPDVARDYVQILSEKTDRLKEMVSDLFDLAKSTSGNISLEMESLDLKKLIEQTIADMDKEIEKSGLKLKIDLPDEPVRIFSDGQKLYRVLQNVMVNALKYALKETRIFVELKRHSGVAEICITNTAGYEMDFTAGEMLQRFARGDRARATEGSGLGLSIADSFTRVTGGRFKISIDGDQFKVIISYPLQADEEQVSLTVDNKAI